jgi:NitT/TauT family transport system ATP-binding protein
MKNMLQPFIHISHLDVTFSGRTGKLVALHDLSFKVATREFVCVLGPSGCGKTTLLRAIAGLIKPSQGKILFESMQTRPRVGLVFQQANLMPWRTVIANITLPLELQSISSEEAEEKARSWIHEVGLEGFEYAWPRDLSGGMAQRVAIARAFIQDPDFLLLDEPFGALDALTRERMGGELLNIWQHQRKTVVMVTHSIAEALMLSDRVIVLTSRPGHVCLDLPIEFTRPRKEELRYTAKFGKMANNLRAAIET